ncbi:hypothetical protein [Pleionea sediminis]|uniref:hypothetical protein n=1 Tax=Pleionea sediminis TaxID=2569479 RepID=UPI001185E546|nr:hypothetical protein [Pleionea sediminis]
MKGSRSEILEECRKLTEKSSSILNSVKRDREQAANEHEKTISRAEFILTQKSIDEMNEEARKEMMQAKQILAEKFEPFNDDSALTKQKKPFFVPNAV